MGGTCVSALVQRRPPSRLFPRPAQALVPGGALTILTRTISGLLKLDKAQTRLPISHAGLWPSSTAFPASRSPSFVLPGVQAQTSAHLGLPSSPPPRPSAHPATSSPAAHLSPTFPFSARQQTNPLSRASHQVIPGSRAYLGITTLALAHWFRCSGPCCSPPPLCSPASGPLHLLFLPPDVLCLQTFMGLCSPICSGLSSNATSLEKPCLTTLAKIGSPTPRPLPVPFPGFHSFMSSLSS